MRIQTVINVGYPLHGGAQITHLTFLRLLHERFGHECVYVDAAGAAAAPRRQTGVRQYAFRDREELKAITRHVRPDVVIGALDVVHDLLPITRRFGVPLVAYLNSFEYCPPAAGERRRWLVSTARDYPTAADRRFVWQHADGVAVNSRFLRDRLLRREGVRARVIHPPFDPRLHGVENHDAERAAFVTGVCGYPHKGVEIFHALARAFPEQRFLLPGPVHHAWYPRLRALPNVSFAPFDEPRRFLALSRVVLVPSQWPEPFGRIAVEAMANGIPLLASRTGGLREILGRGAPGGVADFRNPEAWERALRALLGSARGFRRSARLSRVRARRFLGDRPVRRLHDLLTGIARSKPAPAHARVVVALCGRRDDSTAFARINARWSAALARAPHTDLVADGDALHRRSLDVVLHHDYAEPFSDAVLPEEGRAVAVRTWDFGPYPPAWVEKIRAQFDELWVYSRWTRRQAVRSGIPAARVRVVPPGIDTRVYRSRGPRRTLPTRKRFRFLFVGATVARKGADLLLRAYRQAFRRDDDVCLVIKDFSGDLFYRQDPTRREVRRLAGAGSDSRAAADGPEILYIDEYLPDAELASLYRACDVGVFPYRAEGFGLPILEAMACGLPCVVPRHGACLDYCDRRTSFFVPARRIALPVGRTLAFNALGFSETVEAVDFCEPDVEALARLLRRLTEMPDATLRATGRRAARQAAAFRWERSAARLLAALRDLRTGAVPERIRRRRREAERRRRQMQAAIRLFRASQAEHTVSPSPAAENREGGSAASLPAPAS